MQLVVAFQIIYLSYNYIYICEYIGRIKNNSPSKLNEKLNYTHPTRDRSSRYNQIHSATFHRSPSVPI